MKDGLFAEEVTAFLSDLFDTDNRNEIEQWKTLTPTELGVLSWHLDNLYCDALWWLEESR